MNKYLNQKTAFLLTTLIGCIFDLININLLLIFIKVFIGLSTTVLVWKIVNHTKTFLKNTETKSQLMHFLMLFQLIPSILFALLYQNDLWITSFIMLTQYSATVFVLKLLFYIILFLYIFKLVYQINIFLLLKVMLLKLLILITSYIYKAYSKCVNKLVQWRYIVFVIWYYEKLKLHNKSIRVIGF